MNKQKSVMKKQKEITFNRVEKEWLWTGMWNLICNREKQGYGNTSEQTLCQSIYLKLDEELFPENEIIRRDQRRDWGL